MLDAPLAAQLKGLLTNIVQPIELVASLDDRPKSAELAALLEQIAGMSDLVTYRRDDEAATDGRRPSFTIARVGTDLRVRFAGIPLGHEFTSFALALIQVGGHPAKVAAELLQQIADLPGEHTFETYMSLSCVNCPDVVQALNIISITNPNIRHIAIEGSLFQDEIADRNILSVPTVFMDGELFGAGRMSVDDIVSKLDSGADAKAAERLSAVEPYEVLVVGGGPAGASAAIYAARKGIRTGLVAERFGGQVNDTMAIENLVSVPYTEGPELVTQLREHVGKYEVELTHSQVAARLIPAEGDEPVKIELANGGVLRGTSVVLATGARWRTMGVPGEEEYRNKGVTFCPHCDGPLFKGKRVAVIGGGNSGIEAAIDLAGLVGHVTVIEFLDVLRADDVLVRKLKSLPNVDIVMNARTTEVLGDGRQVTGLSYEDRLTGELKQVDLNGIFVQIGLLPNTEWLRGSIELTERGEIIVDEHGATSVPGVYAAGDVTTEPYKQIVVALGSGSTAALGAFDHLIRSSAPAADSELASL